MMKNSNLFSELLCSYQSSLEEAKAYDIKQRSLNNNVVREKRKRVTYLRRKYFPSE